MSEELTNALYYLRRELSRLASEVESLNRNIESIDSRLSSIEDDVESIKNDIRELENEIDEAKEYLEQKIEDVRAELEKQISSTRIYLENKIIETENKLRDKIKETEKKLNERIDKTEQRIDQHLTEQDTVLEVNSEGLLSSIVIQMLSSLMSNIVSVAHVTIGQLYSHPLIVIEESDYIHAIYIMKREDKNLVEKFRSLKEILSIYTGKEIKEYIFSMKPEEGIPLWLMKKIST